MLASVAAMSLVCCSEKTHKYRIGISQCSDDKWRQKQNSEFRFMSYINDSVEVDIKSAKDNNVQQAAQIDSLVDEGIDLLVVCPNQLDGVTKAIERAYDKGIPVIFFDRTTNSNKYTAFIGCDNYRIGFDLGTYIANQLNGSGRVVEIRGLDNSSPAKGRHEGFVDALKNYPDVKIVASEGADWEQTGAEKAMEKIRQRPPISTMSMPITTVWRMPHTSPCAATTSRERQNSWVWTGCSAKAEEWRW